MRNCILLALLLCLCAFTPAPEDIAGWSFTVSKGNDRGVKVVTSPVRSGRSAIAFTLHPGACSGNDCDNDRERVELKQTEYQHDGETWWYAWSFFIPDDFVSIWPAREFIGQFHQEEDEPAMLFSLEPRGLVFESRYMKNQKPLMVRRDELRGRWHDVIMRVTWSRSRGHVFLEVDGKPVADREQQTMTKDDVYFKFGIYRAHLSRAPAPAKVPVQTVIYDRLRRAMTEDGLKR
jgi:hypothetical protein